MLVNLPSITQQHGFSAQWHTSNFPKCILLAHQVAAVLGNASHCACLHFTPLSFHLPKSAVLLPLWAGYTFTHICLMRGSWKILSPENLRFFLAMPLEMHAHKTVQLLSNLTVDISQKFCYSKCMRRNHQYAVIPQRV